MYGRVSALEITISESELVEAFRAMGGLPEGEYDEADLSELGGVTDTIVEDSFAYSFDEKGGFKANYDVRQGVELDIENVEQAYRAYLASLESGDITVPMLCDMQKYREHVKEDGYEARYRFAYVGNNATLEFVGLQNYLRHEIELVAARRDEALADLEVMKARWEEALKDLELAQAERDEKQRFLDDAAGTINRAAADITRLEERLQNAAAEADENRTLRQRVFQLEAGGEQIDRWVQGETALDATDAVMEITELLSRTPGPWTRQDDQYEG